MRKLLNIFILTSWGVLVYAQQDAQFSQNMFNHMTVNPGSAGSDDKINLTALNRNQWMNFVKEGSPTTILFTASGPLSLFGHSHGLGLLFLQDKIGFNTDINVKFTYAYRYKIADEIFGIGAGIGFYNYSLDASKFIKPSSNSNDDAIPTTSEKGVQALDLSFGLYKTEKIYMGVSSNHLNEATIDLSGSEPYLVRDFYVTAGYNYQLPNPSFEIVPSFLIQTDIKTVQLNLNTNLVYNNKVWGGLSLRPSESITAMIGFELAGGFKVGCAYDFVTNDIGLRTRNSLEFFMNYSFKLRKEKTPQRYKSVRFL